MWCKICSCINGKGKMLVLKLDTPYKHVFCQKKTILALFKLVVGDIFTTNMLCNAKMKKIMMEGMQNQI